MATHAFIATITMSLTLDDESFPKGHQTPEAMAAFTEKQIQDGDAGVEDVVGWGENHTVTIRPA